MSPKNTPKLPIINLSSSTEWDSKRAQVRRAAEEFGCFEAVFNKITLETQRAILGSAQELFDLPLETKLKNVSEKPFHGYIGQSSYTPLFESMGFDEVIVHEKIETLTNILWPQGNSYFCKTVHSYCKHLSDLDEIVRKMIFESLGVDEKHLKEHLDSSNYLFRVMKYQGTQPGETKLGLTTHTDANFVTILHQLNKVEGLEVQNKKGEWISAKPSPDSLIVLIGDALNVISNCRLHSPKHRVTITGNESRYSTGLFCVPKLGCIIKTLDELVDEEHPLLFKPYDYHEFLRFYNTEAGRNAESALKIFCGI